MKLFEKVNLSSIKKNFPRNKIRIILMTVLVIIKPMKLFKKVKLSSVKENFLRNKVKIILMIVLAIVLYIYQINITDIFLIVYFVAAILFHLDSRIAIAIGLIFLILTPTLRIIKGFGLNPWDDQMALYAYKFLVIGILHQTLDFFMYSRRKRVQKQKFKPQNR